MPPLPNNRESNISPRNGRAIFSRYIKTNKNRVQGYIEGNRWINLKNRPREDQETTLPTWSRLRILHFLGTLGAAKNDTRQLTNFEREGNTEGISRHTLSNSYRLLNDPQKDWCPIPLKSWVKGLKVKSLNRATNKNYIFNAYVRIKFEVPGT